MPNRSSSITRPSRTMANLAPSFRDAVASVVAQIMLIAASPPLSRRTERADGKRRRQTSAIVSNWFWIHPVKLPLLYFAPLTGAV